MSSKRKEDEPKGGLPSWMGTYGDMVTLLLCFFVLLFSMSSVDVRKFQEAMSSFKDRIDILKGGSALTEGDLLANGINQLNDMQVVFSQAMPVDADGMELEASENEEDAENEEEAESQEQEQMDTAIAYSQEQIEVMKEVAELQKEQSSEIAEDISQILEKSGYKSEIEVKPEANYINFVLEGEYFFDSGRADIKPETRSAIAAIAEVLNQEKYRGYEIQVEGHTDNVPHISPEFENNWVLSTYRAYNVLNELLVNYDFDPEKVSATGYGEFRPIVDNLTAENRAKNRRVEIKLLVDSKLEVEEDDGLGDINNKQEDDGLNEVNSTDI